MKIALTISLALVVGCLSEQGFAEFRWSNPIEGSSIDIPQSESVSHAAFRSPSMDVDVGYCICLPPGYAESTKRYPVIYMLHGGHVDGDERKLLKLMPSIWELRERRGESIPMIYVFVNGGAVSFFNYPDKKSMAEDLFIKELIPHIDQNYRTIADRAGRGIEGYSGGGRAVARIAFKHPTLFASAVAGSGGFDSEKLLAETGVLRDLSGFFPGDNAYDTARVYAHTKQPTIPLLIIIGTEDYNYESNIAYMRFLEELAIPYEKSIVPDAGHGPKQLYPKVGREIIQFHKRNLLAPR